MTTQGVKLVFAVQIVEMCQQCVEVFEVYLDCYHSTKERAEQTPGERPFEFSEMYIFGKFRAFCERSVYQIISRWCDRFINR